MDEATIGSIVMAALGMLIILVSVLISKLLCAKQINKRLLELDVITEQKPIVTQPTDTVKPETETKPEITKIGVVEERTPIEKEEPEEEPEEIAETYKIKAFCNNCKWNDYLVFNKGQKANLKKIECPRCSVIGDLIQDSG